MIPPGNKRSMESTRMLIRSSSMSLTLRGVKTSVPAVGMVSPDHQAPPGNFHPNLDTQPLIIIHL